MLNNENFHVSESQIYGSQSQTHTRMQVWVYDPEILNSKKIFKLKSIHFVGPWVAEFSIIGYYRKKETIKLERYFANKVVSFLQYQLLLSKVVFKAVRLSGHVHA